LDFCSVCGNCLTRRGDGSLICRNGHIAEDALTKRRRQALAEKKRQMQQRLLTFPNPEKERVVVFRIKNPFQQPTGFRRTDGENTPTFRVYQRITQLTEDYPPDELKRVVGSPWAKGSRENRYGLIICTERIANIVQGEIESIILEDGKHFSLEEIDLTTPQTRQMIDELRSDMAKNLEKNDPAEL
jgi:hypothetical protein